MAGGDCYSTQYFAMYFKVLNSSCRRVSERIDHKDDWAFCSDFIFVLSSYNYSKIADKAQVLTSSNCIRNRELHFIYDAMQTLSFHSSQPTISY